MSDTPLVLHLTGTAGQSFAVWNAEGLQMYLEGDANDYIGKCMAGGVVTVLGETGYNFGAGMTGGFAYVLDESRRFIDGYNRELVELFRVSGEGLEEH